MKNHKTNKGESFHKIWNSSSPNIPDKEVEESWEKFSKRLKPQTKIGIKRNLVRIGSVAAILLVLFSTYFYVEVYNPVLTAKNLSLAEKKISLPDGSLVFLKKGATIKYKENFEDARGVKLIGSAYFDVAEDSLRPFRISTGATLIKVLGTTFYIDGKKGTENVKVSLFTGEVLVSVRNKPETWNMDPGDRFVYEEGKTHIEKFNVNLSFNRQNEFIDINEVKLKEVYEFLSERFDYDFITEEAIENKEVTLRINKSDSLTQILEVLSIINNTSYEINKKTKIIQAINK